MALAPVEWRLRSVSAVAVPVGNANLSMLINCRFSGIAMKQPSVATHASHPIICQYPIGWPVQR